MSKRLLYPIIFTLFIIITNFVIEPYLNKLQQASIISEQLYRLIYWALNASVTTTLAIIIYYMGKHIAGVKQISMMIILNAILDMYRIYIFPDMALITGVVTMFTGIYICAYGLVINKRIKFKKETGIFFFLFGPVYIVRFPFFIDLLLLYTFKFITKADQADFYLAWNINPNYIIIILEIIALDYLLREKQAVQIVRERLYGQEKVT